MPFKSKAQQRFMFAKHPQMAKRWADETSIKKLPQKLHPERTIPRNKRVKTMTKKASEGMFFEKRSQPQAGRFFRDMPGRTEADFHSKAAMDGAIPQGGGMNVSPPGAAMGGLGQRGAGMSGGMYGTGDGDKKDDKKKGADDAERLAALLANKGKEKKESDDEEKTAGRAPSDWDADAGIPTGFHRPASEQPEALESGGERFNSSKAKGPSHGLVEGGSLQLGKASGHQLGKQASAQSSPPRFLGTSFALQKTAKMKYDPKWGENVKSYAKTRGEEAGKSLGRAGEYAKERLGETGKSLGQAGKYVTSKADEGVKAITKSPAAAAIAALLLGRAGFRGLKGAGRLIARGGRRAPKPQGLVSQAVGAAKKLMTGR